MHCSENVKLLFTTWVFPYYKGVNLCQTITRKSFTAKVDQINDLFPQIDRRQIESELQDALT